MQTETLKVTGMTCEGCTKSVAHALKALNGVHEVVVSLSAGEASVRYDEHLTSHDQLKSVLKNVGYDVDCTNTAQKPQVKDGCCG